MKKIVALLMSCMVLVAMGQNVKFQENLTSFNKQFTTAEEYMVKADNYLAKADKAKRIEGAQDYCNRTLSSLKKVLVRLHSAEKYMKKAHKEAESIGCASTLEIIEEYNKLAAAFIKTVEAAEKHAQRGDDCNKMKKMKDYIHKGTKEIQHSKEKITALRTKVDAISASCS